jgi:hypothetical protein
MTYEEYAYRAWPILCELAAEESVITYKDLGELIGIPQPRIGRVLSVIQDYCLEAKLPPLTILVVNKATRRPGEGFIAWDPANESLFLAQAATGAIVPSVSRSRAYAFRSSALAKAR